MPNFKVDKFEEITIAPELQNGVQSIRFKLEGIINASGVLLDDCYLNKGLTKIYIDKIDDLLRIGVGKGNYEINTKKEPEKTLTYGRLPICDIKFPDNALVSRSHGTIRVQGDELIIAENPKVTNPLLGDFIISRKVPESEENIEPEVNNYSAGDKVYIPRNSGLITPADIHDILPDSRIRVIWKEPDQYKRKYSNPSELDLYNDPLDSRFKYPSEKEFIKPNEVDRSWPTMDIIGDLHGNLMGFWLNLKSLNLINEKKEWIGGNRILILLGDIDADRCNGGLEILLEIDRLKRQAQKQGGNIVCIAGNHDDWGNSFLMNKKIIGHTKTPAKICKKNNSGIGLLQYKRFGSEKLQQMHNDDPEIWDQLTQEQENIIKNMRQIEEGLRILKTKCNSKLLLQINDILFHHAPLSHEMSTLILEKGVDKINQIYQNGLRMSLYEGKNNLPYEFHCITDSFLDTNISYHRRGIHEMLFPSDAKNLQNKGINFSIHGHETDEGPRMIGTLLRYSIDNRSFQSPSQDPLKEENRSIARIDKNGIGIGPSLYQRINFIDQNNPSYWERFTSNEKTADTAEQP
ncbi:MAG: hypothetical protein UR27_C0015G0030 [Candidatus Peregrinibacteria bacterium GW2011_GWA2_33_10]|nr:MAG: hypothetical protein UR27_C0015G0030 [Candidatus Peregrinibacteria bacterium GW2011_GWA2_33_10]KKP39532.1 MAG: hypothetical protein UR30_C0010G0028 [Candidatus Peregrinibacteria bacterium GW2011_GWC2_33_13]OGJ46660.1 MAG: hypothetical protein A2229_04570 [Candidatus Peregrinibacteria bacterium RIFOXYA2_FULL_33_7]